MHRIGCRTREARNAETETIGQTSFSSASGLEGGCCMLRNILIGLTILVLCVFGYVGYSSYLAGKTAPREEIYIGANPAPADRPQTEGSKEALPAIPSTGSDPGAGAPLTSQASGPTGGMTPPATDSMVPNPPNRNDLRRLRSLPALSAGRFDVASEYRQW